MSAKIAFQGRIGAYSHLACKTLHPSMEVMPCHTFDEVFEAVETGKAALGAIPVDNSTAGRVADVHHLMPKTSLSIIEEYFQPIHHCLVAPKGASLQSVKEVHSHVQALGQCRETLKTLGLQMVEHADTAGAAEEIAQVQDITKAAISSSFAAKIYGLEVLKENIQDMDHNTTRFLILSPKEKMPAQGEECITSFLFKVRNIPASLYKALGGFATNGINMIKLESYMVDGHFEAAQFYADVIGHPEDKNFQLALEELGFFTDDIKLLGTYPIHNFRKNK
jgi:prephenate dehydratase